MNQGKIMMRTLPALVACLASGYAAASGFALQSQNGSSNGNAYAGAAAAAEDASTVFFNPAGMTYLPEGHSVSLAGTLLIRSINFTDTGTNTPAAYPLGTNGGDAGNTSLIPAGYWSYSVSPALRIGMGISPTFGNKTEYQKDFMGRFSGYYADMKFINYNPSVAYKVNDAISLGGGIDYVTSEVEFRQMVSAGIQRSSSLRGRDNAWGYNFGAMFQVTPSTRIGVTYRSRVEFKLQGTNNVEAFSDKRIKSELDTPATVSYALNHKLNSQWELLADATQTRWSAIQSLVVYNLDTNAYVTTLPYLFKDTWRYGIGANYALNDAWKLRFGVAYDEAPVQRVADRTMTLPDSDRTWLSFGARWAVSKTSSLDFGYSHIFFKSTSTAKAATASGTSQIVSGNFKAAADLLSLQYNVNF